LFFVFCFLFLLVKFSLLGGGFSALFIVFTNLLCVILDLLENNLSVNGFVYVPVIFVLFLRILFFNLCGLVPFFFTATSLFVVAFFFAFGVIGGTLIISIFENRENFWLSFLPPNSPSIMLPALVLVELVSYIARVFSLAVRLFANMTAGHMLLDMVVYAAFFSIFQNLSVLFILPSVVVLFIYLLELCIAFLQAYIFCTLSIIYIDNAVNLH
jgi:ATP synthase subunit 6